MLTMMTLPLTVLLALTVPPSAPVEVRDQTAFFELHGRTVDVIAAEVVHRGAVHASGRHAWGLTEWNVRINYVLQPDGERCTLAAPRVTLDVTTTLPRWRPRGTVSPGVRRLWEGMAAKLIAHEQVHREHGIQAAHSTAAALAAVPAQADCRAVEQLAIAAMRRAVTQAD